MIETQIAPVVSFESVTFAYPRGDTVLDIPSLVVAKGERFFLHGPSGSGKTTFLGLVAGILSPTSGVVRTLGTSMSDLSAHQRDKFRGSHCGYVFQMFNLLPYLSVRQNILLPCELNYTRMERLSKQGHPQEVLQEIASRLGISSILDRAAADLSVGQQQRVAAARALLGAPELLIADEPTSALDLDRRKAFLDLLFQEAESSTTTILFVSHDHTLMPLFSRVQSLREINHAASKEVVF